MRLALDGTLVLAHSDAVDDARAIRRLDAAGVDAIVTNDPQMVRATLTP